MPGSISAQLLPAGGSFDPGVRGSATPDGLASGSPAGSAFGPAAPCEPPAEPPLLRGDGGALVGEGPSDRVREIVGQLTPIRSRAALVSSFEREANPDDEFVRAAYECAWADLVLGLARTNTRRARIRATMVQARGNGVRGRG